MLAALSELNLLNSGRRRNNLGKGTMAKRPISNFVTEKLKNPPIQFITLLF